LACTTPPSARWTHLWRRGAALDHRHHLIAGFASTVGWPLTALGLESIGWRNTCFAWALAHILIGLPLNFFMLPAVKAPRRLSRHPSNLTSRSIGPCLLAFAFAAAWSVTGAMAAHLPRILEAAEQPPCRQCRPAR